MNSLTPINNTSLWINNDLSIDSIINYYIQITCSRKNKKINLDTSTASQYQSVLKEFVDITNTNMTNLNIVQILKYKDIIYQQSANTIRNKVSIISGFIEFLDMAKIAPQGLSKREFRFLFKDLPREIVPDQPIDEIQSQLNKMKAITEVGSRIYTILSIFINNYIRVSELIHLKVEDIERNQFNVWQMHITTAKGDKPFYTPLSDELIDDISIYMENNQIFEGWLFPSRKKKNYPITRQQVFYDIKKVASQVGIDFSPHTLRHFGAHYALQSGESIERVNEKLNHTDMKTTKRYVHIDKILLKQKPRKMF